MVKMRTLTPQIIKALVLVLLVLVSSSDASFCYQCGYSSSDPSSATCGQKVDPTVSENCYGSVCISYYQHSEKGFSSIYRGCGELLYDITIERCLQFGPTFYIFENQCCFAVDDSHSASTSCICVGDYCNANVSRPILTPSVDPPSSNTTSVYQNSTSPRMTCVKCVGLYPSSSSENSSHTECGTTVNSTEIDSCIGSGCYTYSYDKHGISVMDRGCRDFPSYISIDNCLQNNLGLNETFFVFENQCCHRLPWGGIYCYCNGDYCNTNVTSPQSKSINCYSCRSYDNNAAACSETVDTSAVTTCFSSSCYFNGYVYPGYEYVERGCGPVPYNYLSYQRCLEYSKFDSSYFLQGDQCCQSTQNMYWASISCVCTTDNCNFNATLPKLLSQSNATIYNPFMGDTNGTVLPFFSTTPNPTGNLTCVRCLYIQHPGSSMTKTCEGNSPSMCSTGQACYNYDYISYDTVMTYQGCSPLPSDAFSIDNCLSNSLDIYRINGTLFTVEKQCCYYSYDLNYSWNATICYCLEENCNRNISKPTPIQYSNAVKCYACNYNTNPSYYGQSTCGYPLDTNRVSTCNAPACFTNVNVFGGNLVISRGCRQIAQDTRDIGHCLENSQIFNRTYYKQGNQCCYTTEDMYSLYTYCFCTSNYCNDDVIIPSLLNTSASFNSSNWWSSQESNSTLSTAKPYDWYTCFTCIYTNSTGQRGYSTCNETLDPSTAATCGHPACFSSTYAIYDYVMSYRGCSSLPANFSVDRCLENNVGLNETFYMFGNQCCYMHHDENMKWNATSCYCTGDFCNLNVSQAALIPQQNTSTCYACGYSSNSYIYGESTCSYPFDTNEVKTCSASACYAYIYVRNGDMYINRGCGELPTNMFGIDSCLENNKISNTTYFYFGNQCCYTIQENEWSMTYCFCTSDNCNNDITPPTLLYLSTVITPTDVWSSSTSNVIQRTGESAASNFQTVPNVNYSWSDTITNLSATTGFNPAQNGNSTTIGTTIVSGQQYTASAAMNQNSSANNDSVATSPQYITTSGLGEISRMQSSSAERITTSISNAQLDNTTSVLKEFTATTVLPVTSTKRRPTTTKKVVVSDDTNQGPVPGPGRSESNWLNWKRTTTFALMVFAAGLTLITIF